MTTTAINAAGICRVYRHRTCGEPEGVVATSDGGAERSNNANFSWRSQVDLAAMTYSVPPSFVSPDECALIAGDEQTMRTRRRTAPCRDCLVSDLGDVE